MIFINLLKRTKINISNVRNYDVETCRTLLVLLILKETTGYDLINELKEICEKKIVYNSSLSDISDTNLNTNISLILKIINSKKNFIKEKDLNYRISYIG